MPMKVRNGYLEQQSADEFYYHVGLSPNQDTKEAFNDVKFVCLGGKNSRMEKFAKYLHEDVLGEPKNSIFEKGTKKLKNISGHAGRYAMFKTGPCLSVSHGMGMPSFSILLHELFKMLTYCGCDDVIFIRLGTSGGLGIEPGTVVITDQPYSSLLEPYYTQIACGKEHKIESRCDPGVAERILQIARGMNLKTVIGNTMSCEGFYEEQGRMDGALCDFSPDEKMRFLRRAHDECGIRNIEMEANMFGAMCRRYGVKCATVCVTLLDRLVTDHVRDTNYAAFEFHPLEVVAEFIRSSTSSK